MRKLIRKPKVPEFIDLPPSEGGNSKKNTQKSGKEVWGEASRDVFTMPEAENPKDGIEFFGGLKDLVKGIVFGIAEKIYELIGIKSPAPEVTKPKSSDPSKSTNHSAQADVDGVLSDESNSDTTVIIVEDLGGGTAFDEKTIPKSSLDSLKKTLNENERLIKSSKKQ